LHLPIFGSLERWRLVVGADPDPEADEAVPTDATRLEAALAV
jgi:hypothetical protein